MEFITTLPNGGNLFRCSPIIIPPRQVFPINVSLGGKPVRWLPPPPGWTKINTDGAFRGRTSGASSFGVVFRDFRGVIVRAFSSFIGYNKTALEAEMCGIIFAINAAHILGFRKIWLETDSLQAISLLQNMVNDETVPEPLREKWSAAIAKTRFMEVRVSHIYREENTVADKLADFAIKNKGLFQWHMTPDFVFQEAYLDASGHTYFRVKV